MRVSTQKPPDPGVAEGEAVDGYVVESLVAGRGHTELTCAAVGPDGGDATLVVACTRPADRHAWPRIRRLARTRATLEHEALLPVLAFGEHSGRPYIATERYPETTFANLLNEAPLSPERVLMLLAPVAEALDMAHANGLVHQSFSGTSLLVEGHLVLLDGFGVVGGPRELTVESAGVHEVRYCTPEELRGEALEPASNVYSLAALLVHALTGTPAYEGTLVAQTYGHLIEAPPRPSERRPELGVAFDDVIARGLAKDPADRPASASGLFAEAATALGVDLPARRGSGTVQDPGHRAPTEIRSGRIPAPAVAAAVIVAVLAGLAAGVALDPFGGSRAAAAGPKVDARALERLDDQRAPLRAQLSAAETPQEQAATAAELADAYARAAASADSTRLASAARSGERAYDELGAAADRGNADEFASASDEVARAEARIGSLARGSR
jgi:hypothetical protein